jgi:two-component system sensor histidine kinase/response regulator
LKLLESRPDKTSAWLSQEEIDTESMIAFFSKYKAKKAKREGDLNLQLADAKIRFSAKSFQKIVIELVDNAFKFSDPGTPIHVVSIVEENQFRLTIIDRGWGMSMKQIAHIDSFVRLEDDWYEQQGPGMGLPIVRLLVELNGGNLNINSTPKQGTTVTVKLVTDVTHIMMSQ